MRTFVLAVVVLSFGNGCGMYFYERKVVFNEDEYKAYAEAGTGSISGQAFLKTQGGDVKYGAGNAVTATPVTSYSEEWFREYRQGYAVRKISEADPREAKYRRTVSADGQGNFLIEGLPPGEYFISTRLTWNYPSHIQGVGWITATTGGGIGARVKLGQGEKKERVILTR